MAANINQSIDIILQYHDVLKNIFTASWHEFKGRVLTRSAVDRSDPSCRMWQLFLCLLNVLERKKPGTIMRLISVANKSNQLYPFLRDYIQLLRSIIANPNSLLNELFIQTHITENIIQIDTVNDLQQGFNYLGICIKYNNEKNNHISHYFTIVRMGNRFFVESAYGSEYIHTPPYLTEVSPDEIQELITSLRVLHEAENDIKLNEGPMRFITYFYNTYFFKGNMPKYPTNKEMRETLDISEKSAKRFQPISTPEERELQTVFRGNHINIYVGLIQDYEQILDKYITTQGLTFKSSSQYGKKKKNTQKKNKPFSPYNKTQRTKTLPGHTNGGKHNKKYKSITYKKKCRYS